MRNVTELNVFIASPSDLSPERGIVREVCGRLSRGILIQGYGISFKAIGWEDVSPAPIFHLFVDFSPTIV